MRLVGQRATTWHSISTVVRLVERDQNPKWAGHIVVLSVAERCVSSWILRAGDNTVDTAAGQRQTPAV